MLFENLSFQLVYSPGKRSLAALRVEGSQTRTVPMIRPVFDTARSCSQRSVGKMPWLPLEYRLRLLQVSISQTLLPWCATKCSSRWHFPRLLRPSQHRQVRLGLLMLFNKHYAIVVGGALCPLSPCRGPKAAGKAKTSQAKGLSSVKCRPGRQNGI